MADPNFPPNLDIHPLLADGAGAHGGHDGPAQAAAIATYGIAGRVWEASLALRAYLTPGATFDPPCSIHAAPPPRRILELGSGQAVASLRLAEHLAAEDTVVLTDLPSVVPLCEASAHAWAARRGGAGEYGSGSESGGVGESGGEREDGGAGGAGPGARVIVRPLAWGEDGTAVRALGPFTHILMCDLVYFPHLYPPLLSTLLEMTEPAPDTGTAGAAEDAHADVFGPQVIIAYRTRQLALEQPFFDALAAYFRLAPVLDPAGAPPAAWGDTRVLVARRWATTDAWARPAVRDVMRGPPAGSVVRGREWALEDALLGAVEWD